MVKICSVCGKEFETSTAAKTCGPECKKILFRNTKRICNIRNKMGIYAPKKKKEKVKAKAIRYTNPFTRELETLCWSCQNATGGCSWSRTLKPVKGWNAKAIKIKASEGKEFVRYTDSYIVKKCPKYIKDS